MKAVITAASIHRSPDVTSAGAIASISQALAPDVNQALIAAATPTTDPPICTTGCLAVTP